MTEPLQVTEVLRPKVWIEDTIFGQRIVVVHHEGIMEPFDYCVFNYQYGYTDNASTLAAATAMAVSLGAVEPVERRSRDCATAIRSSGREG